MAVLVEAISVVVRRSRIDAVYPGGWPQFERDCPNGTLCADAELARLGFLSPAEIGEAISWLEENGLRFHDGEQAVDLVVVDQLRGPTTRCDWLEFARFRTDAAGGRISAAWLYDRPRSGAGLHLEDGTSIQIATPAGWVYETSMSHRFGFAPAEGVTDTARFLADEPFEIVVHEGSGRRAFSVGGEKPTS